MDLTYDPADPATNADPFPLFARLRREAPVYDSPALGGWMVTRYQDVVAALKDPKLSSDRISPFERQLGPEEREDLADLFAHVGRWSVFLDPPKHTRLRGLFSRAFTSRAVEQLRADIDRIVVELIDGWRGRREIELIDDLAYPLPARVICAMLGVPTTDLDALQVWSDDVATYIGLPKKPPEVAQAAKRSVQELDRYFGGVVEDHRRHPGDDLVHRMLRASDEGDSLTEEEIIATCSLLLFAAHTTTTHLIGNGLLALLRHPEQLALLRARPELLDSAIEEFLRYDGPIQAVRRVALERTRVGDQTIEPGQLVFLMINAANRDPAEFPDAERFDIARTDNNHITFGHGIHYCVGAPLAKIEARAAFRHLLSRSKQIALGEPEEGLAWLRSFGFRGLKRLLLVGAFDG